MTLTEKEQKVIRRMIREEFDRGAGMFTMDFLTQLEQAYYTKQKSLDQIKKEMKDVVQKSLANFANKNKALSMIANSGSFKTLMIAAGNFSLSHHSSDYKVFKPGDK